MSPLVIGISSRGRLLNNSSSPILNSRLNEYLRLVAYIRSGSHSWSSIYWRWHTGLYYALSMYNRLLLVHWCRLLINYLLLRLLLVHLCRHWLLLNYLLLLWSVLLLLLLRWIILLLLLWRRLVILLLLRRWRLLLLWGLLHLSLLLWLLLRLRWSYNTSKRANHFVTIWTPNNRTCAWIYFNFITAFTTFDYSFLELFRRNILYKSTITRTLSACVSRSILVLSRLLLAPFTVF
mmetsp:Transcript_9352/g.10347  ORF Transcript_9352/g.10347 Transcript_9352/m.10347 type:complete len:235 (-) Transcript_9352:347-1051(-)